MKTYLKNQKGITLIVLMLTIIVIAILAGAVVTNIDIGEDIRNYNYMRADIELLEGKIMTYYNENGNISGIIGNEVDITGVATLVNQASSRDNENYYQINISKLYNVTLNYGGGTVDNGDIYIVNEQSHEVYYLQGAYFENELYHTEM